MDNIASYIFNIDTVASIGFQHWCLLLVVIVKIACAQNCFYRFRMVVTCATFSLLAVAKFLVAVICL